MKIDFDKLDPEDPTEALEQLRLTYPTQSNLEVIESPEFEKLSETAAMAYVATTALELLHRQEPFATATDAGTHVAHLLHTIGFHR